MNEKCEYRAFNDVIHYCLTKKECLYQDQTLMVESIEDGFRQFPGCKDITEKFTQITDRKISEYIGMVLK